MVSDQSHSIHQSLHTYVHYFGSIPLVRAHQSEQRTKEYSSTERRDGSGVARGSNCPPPWRVIWVLLGPPKRKKKYVKRKLDAL